LESEFLMESPTDYSIVEGIESYMDKKELLSLEKEKNYQNVQAFSIDKNTDLTLDIIASLMEK